MSEPEPGRWLKALMAMMLPLALSACALIPTSGPVEQVDEPAVGMGAPQVDRQPMPPVPGGTPDQIVNGFLMAVSSGSATRFSVARQYLTQQAARDWNPAESVTIFDSTRGGLNSAEDSATLKSPVLGRIDTDGHYDAVSDVEYAHDFMMTKDAGGQWRIGDPGQGILISQYTFEQAFRAVPVYFFDATFDRLAIENLYMNWADATVTTAMEGLLKGPSAWLSGAAASAIPPQTQLAVGSVPVSGTGVAQLSLTQQVLGLSETQKVQMVSQMLMTLQAFPGVTGLRIDVAGIPLSVRGQDIEGVVRLDAVPAYQPVGQPASQDVFGLLADGSVARVPAIDGAQPRPILGPLGASGWGDTPIQIAAGPDGIRLALVSATSLWAASAVSGLPPSKLFDAPGLTRPQITETETWVISAGEAEGDPPRIWLITPYGAVQPAQPLTELTGAKVTAFRVSPDRTRIAVVANVEGHDVLGLMRIRSTAPLMIDGWRPLTVNIGRDSMASCLDVSWLSSTQLAVLATTSGNVAASAYRMDIDAASVQSMGPSTGDAPAMLAVQPRPSGTTAMAVTGAGAVLRYEDTTRWTEVATGFSAIALPG